MPIKFRILPYKMEATSARILADVLRALRIRCDRSTYRKAPTHRIINWGNSSPVYDHLFTDGDYNPPYAVSRAVDKIHSYLTFSVHGVNHPELALGQEKAREWLANGETVYGRDIETGHGGAGICVMKPGDAFVEHLFYTKKVPNYEEYRIHISRDGYVIDQQVKRRPQGSGLNIDVKSHGRGWKFCRTDCNPSPEVIEQARKAVASLDLDFGAVDVCTSKSGKVNVFEVNTAPGIEGTTVERYTQYFMETANERA